MNRFFQRNRVWILLGILVVIVAIALSIDILPSAETRPLGGADEVEALASRAADGDLNVIFILVDTLRADHLSAYGYERDTSPSLKYFSSRGVRFDRHLSQSSWTKSSMASLWTALYPASTGITRYEHGLPDEAEMPAEILGDAGYQTVGLYRNGWVAPRFGFGQGFEVYTRPTGTKRDRRIKRENPTVRVAGSDADSIDVAIEFIRTADRDRPWFLYLHLMDLHQYTYSEDTAIYGSRQVDLYDNSIRWTDSVLDGLMTFLAESGELENSLIILTSDHGEAFRERGIEGHARKVYRETTHVPFMIFFPFNLDPGIEINLPTSGVDVWPTILDLLGLPALSRSEGVSRKPEILAALRGNSIAPATSPAYAFLEQRWGQPLSEHLFPTLSIVEGDFRYVYTKGRDGGQRRELFDARGDPGEFRNVILEEETEASRMEELTQEYLKRKSIWSEGVETLQLDELELNQLRALGYEIP